MLTTLCLFLFIFCSEAVSDQDTHCSIAINAAHNSTTTLLAMITHHLQTPTNAFQDVIHSIALNKPDVFDSITRKLIDKDTDQAGQFMKYFIKTATKELFNQYAFIHNHLRPFPRVTTLDLWQLLNLFNQDWIFSQFIIDIEYFSNIRTFIVHIKIGSNALACYGCNTLSEIPDTLALSVVPPAQSPRCIQLKAYIERSMISTAQSDLLSWNLELYQTNADVERSRFRIERI